MDIREKINQNPQVLGATALVLILAALGIAFFKPFDPKIPQDSLWFAEQPGNNLVAMSDQLPPVRASGRDYVRAYVFSCGSCTDPKERFIGYLEKFSDDFKADLRKAGIASYEGPGGISSIAPNEFQAMGSASHRFIKSPTDPNWIEYDSKEGGGIRRVVEDHCKTGKLVSCAPTNP